MRNATCLTPIPSSTQGIRSELNSRNPTIPPLKHHQKSCRSHLQLQQLGLTAAKSPSGRHVPLGATSFQTAWRGTRTARRQAPKNPKFYNHRSMGQSTPPGRHAPGGYYFCRYRLAGTSPPPGATKFRTPMFPCYPPGGCDLTARRHTSNKLLLVFVNFVQVPHFSLA